MIDTHSGLPSNTISQWLESDPNNEEQWLKVPSGNSYRVLQILGLDNNEYLVLEVSDWVALAGYKINPDDVKTMVNARIRKFAKIRLLQLIN
jgi:hypothetical protein